MTTISREEYLKDRTKVIEKCEGCNHIIDYDYCESYLHPNMKWRLGNCPAATHIVKEFEQTKKRIGQQKQKKRKKK